MKKYNEVLPDTINAFMKAGAPALEAKHNAREILLLLNETRDKKWNYGAALKLYHNLITIGRHPYAAFMDTYDYYSDGRPALFLREIVRMAYIDAARAASAA